MSEELIVARGLTKKFGDFTAVDGIDFSVFRGESFGLLGPNGAGKSTTMRIIGATSQRTSGEITILGKDRKSTRLNSSHSQQSRMPSSA